MLTRQDIERQRQELKARLQRLNSEGDQRAGDSQALSYVVAKREQEQKQRSRQVNMFVSQQKGSIKEYMAKKMKLEALIQEKNMIAQKIQKTTNYVELAEQKGEKQRDAAEIRRVNLQQAEKGLGRVDQVRQRIKKERNMLSQRQNEILKQKIVFYEKAKYGEEHEVQITQDLIEQYRPHVDQELLLGHLDLIEEQNRRGIKELEEQMRIEGQEEFAKDQYSKAEFVAFLKQADPDLVLLARVIVFQSADKAVDHLQDIKGRFSFLEQERQNAHRMQQNFMAREQQRMNLQASCQTVNDLCSGQMDAAFYDTAEEIYLLDEIARDIFFGALTLVTHQKNTNLLASVLENQPLQEFQFEPIKKEHLFERKIGEASNEQGRIYEVQKLTTDLIQDLDLIQRQERLMQSLAITYEASQLTLSEPCLYAVSRNSCSGCQLFLLFQNGYSRYDSSLPQEDDRQLPRVPCDLRRVLDISFINRTVAVHSVGRIIFGQQPPQKMAWGESLSDDIGRTTSASVNVTCVSIFPSVNLLGESNSLLLGFSDGKVLKYNSNNVRGEHSAYELHNSLSTRPQIGFEPPFPAQIKNLLNIKLKEKPSTGAKEHIFRQFFIGHKTEIVTVEAIGIDQFVSLDKLGNIIFWQISQSKFFKDKGGYVPKMRVRLDFDSYRYKSTEGKIRLIYPKGQFYPRLSPEQLYEKFFQDQLYQNLVYRNFKKNQAFFLNPKEKAASKGELKQLLTVKYEENKIISVSTATYSYEKGDSNVIKGKIFFNKLYVKGSQPHPIRQNIRHYKIVAFDLKAKILNKISYSFEAVSSESFSEFIVSDQMISGHSFLFTANFNRGLMFSIKTGQLIRNFTSFQGRQGELLLKSFGIKGNILLGLDVSGKKLWQIKMSLQQKRRTLAL